MKILLTGAGFTRNWGGWLASEFVGELCGQLQDRPHLNEMMRVYANFEKVYGERLVVAAREPNNDQAQEDVHRMQHAIRYTFRQMNAALLRTNLNFSNAGRCSIKRFLSRFDAIFTLNQDLFFELHYDHMFLDSDGRRDGHCFPGIEPTQEWVNPRSREDRIDMNLQTTSISPVGIRTQPIYKLHGSVNWRNPAGNDVLVIGTGKEDAIARSDLLMEYQRIFGEHVYRGNTQIMIIGYGFADSHINTVLLDGARHHGLSMYLVDPAGQRTFDAHGRTSANGRNEMLEIPLVGVCQRPLREIFADSDNVAFRSFERFLGV